MFYSLGFLRCLLFKFLRISLPYGDKVWRTSPNPPCIPLPDEPRKSAANTRPPGSQITERCSLHLWLIVDMLLLYRFVVGNPQAS
jgi:hypothetical protein